MFFRQYYLQCLSHASYLVGDRSTGKAIVVDPQRDVDHYIADAKAEGLTITSVFETHFHADFLSGHLEIAEKVGPVWGIAPDGEMNNMWRRTAQEGLWFVGGSFTNCRIYSRYVAMQIKAIEEGLIPRS